MPPNFEKNFIWRRRRRDRETRFIRYAIENRQNRVRRGGSQGHGGHCAKGNSTTLHIFSEASTKAVAQIPNVTRQKIQGSRGGDRMHHMRPRTTNDHSRL